MNQETGIWRMDEEERLKLVPDHRRDQAFSYYEIDAKREHFLCRSGWCTLIYFESHAEIGGIERCFCEPGNFLLLRNYECTIETFGGVFWGVGFEKAFFTENFRHMIADCPFYYDFLCAETDEPELLYYSTRPEGEKRLAADMLRSQLCVDDEYTVKNVGIALGLFLTIFHRSHFEDQSISGSTMMKSYMRGQILRYLSENYATATLASTAAHFHYHPNYFSGLFRKLISCEFSKKLQQIRLERARYLLSTTDLSVEQVRAAVGFSEKSYFYKIFRTKYNVTPAAFRRRVQEQKNQKGMEL
jgi:AraC-like DNA-binding protein